VKPAFADFGATMLAILVIAARLSAAPSTSSDKAKTPPPHSDGATNASRAAERKIEETLQGRSMTRTAADVAITARVKTSLIEDAGVTASDINVDTLNGIVYLRGTVGSKAEAQRAVAIAKKTFGVKGVKNVLQIASSGKPAGSGTKSKTSMSGKKSG